MSDYDTLSYRVLCETAGRLTNNDDITAERCYISSNEYLSDYMKGINLKDKKIATVGSSGDQFFVALLQGCKDITIIDANPYTKIFVEYKKALFKNLTFAEMKNVIMSTKPFHWKTYAKISHDLPNSAKTFWDKLFLEVEDKVDERVEKFDQSTIARRLVHPEAIFVNNFYLQEEAYNNLQRLLRKNDYSLKFLTADLHEFPKALREKFDVIMLSNIFAYHATGEAKDKFEKTISKLYKKNLNHNGSIQVHYSYRQHLKSIDVSSLAGHPLRIEEIDTNRQPKTIYYLDKHNEELELQ